MGEQTAPDDAVAFFQEIVEPTVAEFLEMPADRRLGCLACLCLASMADHYFHALPESCVGSANADIFRQKVANANWAVGQVIGVANATKHFQRRPGRVGYKDVSAQQITLGNLRAGWPISGAAVMVEVADGNVWLLTQLVETAMTFWGDRLAA
jgi:hypothetical protein